MSEYKLSKRSRSKLSMVHPDMCAVVCDAIQITEVDFGVTCGLREVDEQAALYAQKKTKTMKSRHLPCLPMNGLRGQPIDDVKVSGAVDLVAYVNGKVSWDPEPYHKIKDAMFKAAEKRGIELRWGGDWDRDGDTTDQTFNDLPHFELYGEKYDYQYDHLGL